MKYLMSVFLRNEMTRAGLRSDTKFDAQVTRDAAKLHQLMKGKGKGKGFYKGYVSGGIGGFLYEFDRAKDRLAAAMELGNLPEHVKFGKNGKKPKELTGDDRPDPEKLVEDIRAGDLVDLESCPFMKHYQSAEFEYAEVAYTRREGATIAIGYEGIDEVGYMRGTKLKVARKAPKESKTSATPTAHV